MADPGKPRSIAPILVLVGLSALWALDSLRNDLLPGPFRAAEVLPPFERLSLYWLLLATAAAALARIQRARRPSRRMAIHASLIGLGLFAIPELLIHVAGTLVPAFTRVAMFSLAPVFAVVLEPYIGVPDYTPLRNGLLSALVAVMGVLLLFPLDLPHSPAQYAAFSAVLLAVLLVASVNCLAVRVVVAYSHHATSLAAFAASATAFTFFAIAAAAGNLAPLSFTLAPQAAWSLLVDFPAFVAFFWLLPHMVAARMTLRFLLAPLFAILFSFILFTPHISLRIAFGLALMAMGSAWMLFVPDSDASTHTSLLHLENNDNA